MRRCSAASLVLNSKIITILLGFTPTYHQALPSRYLRPSNPVVIPLSCSSNIYRKSSISETAKSNNKMENRTPQQPQHQDLINSNPNVSKMQQLVQSDPSGGWEKCWEQELTPWDLGQPTPVIVHLHQTGALPKGRTLVPGCGSGYDVVAIACPERYVVGVDLSDKAIKKAVEFSSSLPNADYFTFLKEDFFIWHPTELFDLIFDYTLVIMSADHHTKYLSLIMKRCCTPWGLKLYPSWKMTWLLELARVERSLEGGRSSLANHHCEREICFFRESNGEAYSSI
ncbi:uncharacterized protein LOC131301816 isoform X2 [Rhododendron vialii]|uniref:uncharacterized protein LOC131301816 isoform X2 n=1 Tax=Rhododendron vialii TaxID=182163 RepID=UPI00265EB817|nr:uncharacterized protein LOC131301816 isoform X2 [Rhododendron vialii]